MLISIAIYILFWIYAEILWRGSFKLRRMSDTKKLARVTMIAGSVIYGMGEIILTRKLAINVATQEEAMFSSAMLFVAVVIYLLTTWGAMLKRKISDKLEILAISALCILVGFIIGFK